MNRQDVVTEIGQRVGVGDDVVREVIDAIRDVLIDGILADGEVAIRGLGKFQVRYRRAQKRRNPRTGVVMDLPARRSVTFLPSGVVRERLNQ